MSTNIPSERYDAIVIGGGKGGKILAVDLGNHGVKTALIERDANMIGGTCINVGCIPTKTFIASARLADAARHAGEYGVRTGDITVDWPAVQKRVDGVVTALRAMNHKNFTSAPALDFILGAGTFSGPNTVEVRTADGAIRQLTADKIFINTGTRPAIPAIPGLADIGPLALTSTTIQRLDTLPEHLVILGGGYIALEFAQMFRRFGSRVTLIERGPQLLAREDADTADEVAKVVRGDGIDLRLSTTVERVEKQGGGVTVAITSNGNPAEVTGSHLLVALGRSPVTEDLNLSIPGVETDAHGFVKVNERLETNVPGIWAIGDVNGGPQFTHASLDDYRILKTNVFGSGGRTTKDRLIPFSLFIEPELARVGLTEKDARAQGHEIRIAKVPTAVIPRARTTGHTAGFLKAVVDTKTQRILGCAILAAEAGEMISTVQMVMVAGLPCTTLRDAVLTHPTMAEGFNNLFANF